MISLKEYLLTENKVTGVECVDMVKTILDELQNKYNDCTYDKDKDEWVGKDGDLWKGASQFLSDYVNTLSQSDLRKIVDAMGWKKWIPDIDDINPFEISICMSNELNK